MPSSSPPPAEDPHRIPPDGCVILTALCLASSALVIFLLHRAFTLLLG